MRRLVIPIAVLAMLGSSRMCVAQWTNAPGKSGFLDRPPVYINNEQDFPLTGLGGAMPGPGETIPDVDISGVSGEEWNQNGKDVQPGLDVELKWIRAGVMHGFGDGWAAGFSVPYYRNLVKGTIGGQPATAIAEGFGNIALGAKKILWEDGCHSSRVALAGGIELPTGKDNSVFGPNNFVTTGYFPGTQRLPLGWQPSTGTLNGLVALSYTRSRGRLSYEGLLAGKIFGASDQDVNIGNILIAAAQGTYGVSRDLAASLGLTLRTQGDDSYPNAPLVGQPALAGTTTHSTILYLDAGIRYVVMRKVTVGVGIRTPINNPDEGMVPTTQVSIIFYPSM